MSSSSIYGADGHLEQVAQSVRVPPAGSVTRSLVSGFLFQPCLLVSVNDVLASVQIGGVWLDTG